MCYAGLAEVSNNCDVEAVGLRGFLCEEVREVRFSSPHWEHVLSF